MRNIVPEILSLDQYLKTQREKPDGLRPIFCPHCGEKDLWNHGHYDRKADRRNTSGETLNPIRIYRFFCPHCSRTCSTLPECLPPRKWYIWNIQQIALMSVLTGKSFVATAKKIMPSRHTISRWIKQFKESWRCHKRTLCQHYNDLTITNTFTDFWLSCFNKTSLSQAMYLCYVAEAK